MPLGSSNSYAYPTKRIIAGAWTRCSFPRNATLTTALTGANNDIVLTSVDPASTANSITYTIVAGGPVSRALSVSVSGSDITVTPATDGAGAITSTAAQIRTALTASGPASALVTHALAAGNDGTGVVTALATTSLSGGTSYRIGGPGKLGPYGRA